MIGVELPTLNSNDSSYTLVEWLVPQGARVESAQPLATVETSKASEEIESTAPGILHILVGAGQDCLPGQTVAYVFDSDEERDAYLARVPAIPEPEAPAPIAQLHLTDAARELADRHGLSHDQLRSLGRTLIRTADIETLLNGSLGKNGTSRRCPGPPN